MSEIPVTYEDIDRSTMDPNTTKGGDTYWTATPVKGVTGNKLKISENQLLRAKGHHSKNRDYYRMGFKDAGGIEPGSEQASSTSDELDPGAVALEGTGIKQPGAEQQRPVAERKAIWHGPKMDVPLTVIGDPEEKDGGKFYKVRSEAGIDSYVPADQVEFTDAVHVEEEPKLSEDTGLENLKSIIQELKNETSSSSEEVNERILTLIEQQNKILEQQAEILKLLAARLAPGQDSPAEVEPETTTESEFIPAYGAGAVLAENGGTNSGALPAESPQTPPYDHEKEGALDGNPPDDSAETPSDSDTEETQQYDWNPSVGDQVRVRRGDGVVEHDWTIINIEGEGDERIFTAGKPPTNHETVRLPYDELLQMQLDGDSQDSEPSGTSAEETVAGGTAVWPSRSQETEPSQPWRRRAWRKITEIVSWPYNRSYNYVMYETDEKQRKRRIAGLVLGGVAVGALLGYAIDLVEDYFEGKHGVPKTGAGGVLRDHGHGEHMDFFNNSQGHRVAGAELPPSLHFGNDSEGHKIVMDSANNVVLDHADLPGGIEKTTGVLSDNAAAWLRDHGHQVTYQRIDGLSPDSSPLYMSEVK